MEINHFNDMLAVARQQRDAQRILLVFVSASLPAQATAEQRASFEAGESGELAPVMCVDKDPSDLKDFAALQAESKSVGQHWALMFAAALSGQERQAPAPAAVDVALNRMVEAIKSGNLSGMIAFDRQGQAVQLG